MLSKYAMLEERLSLIPEQYWGEVATFLDNLRYRIARANYVEDMDNQLERDRAVATMKSIIREIPNLNYEDELASYREEKYGLIITSTKPDSLPFACGI